MFESLFAKGRLSLERLRTLVEVAQAGSITQAATGNLTRQSQYSRQLKELEEFFGTELAKRRGRRLELNAEGRRLAEIGRDVLKQLECFHETRTAESIRLTLGAYDSVIHWRLAGRLSLFLTEFPNVECHLVARSTKDILAGLMDLRLDFGVVRQSAVRPPLKSVPLFKMEHALFAPRDKVPPARAQDARWILENVPLALRQSDGDFNQALEREMQATKLKVRLSCETSVQASRAVLSGTYCSVLPAIAVGEFDEKRYLRLKAPLPGEYERKICLAWHPRLLELRQGFRNYKDRLANCLR